jgi:hypothetical protein
MVQAAIATPARAALDQLAGITAIFINKDSIKGLEDSQQLSAHGQHPILHPIPFTST